MAKILNIFLLIISILQECSGVEEQGECTRDTKDECDEISGDIQKIISWLFFYSFNAA